MGETRRIEWTDGEFNTTVGKVNGVVVFETHFSSDKRHGPERKIRLTHRLPVHPTAEWGLPSHEAAHKFAEEILIEALAQLGFRPVD